MPAPPGRASRIPYTPLHQLELLTRLRCCGETRASLPGFLKCTFLRARPAQRVRHRSVSLMARILQDPFFGIRREDHGERPPRGPCARIVDRHAPFELAVRLWRESLYQAKSIGIGISVDALVPEVRRLDNQRIALETDRARRRDVREPERWRAGGRRAESRARRSSSRSVSRRNQGLGRFRRSCPDVPGIIEPGRPCVMHREPRSRSSHESAGPRPRCAS